MKEDEENVSCLITAIAVVLLFSILISRVGFLMAIAYCILGLIITYILAFIINFIYFFFFTKK